MDDWNGRIEYGPVRLKSTDPEDVATVERLVNDVTQARRDLAHERARANEWLARVHDLRRERDAAYREVNVLRAAMGRAQDTLRHALESAASEAKVG